eukprot:jgi/Tetstr1/429413/TSEL_019323.t1
MGSRCPSGECTYMNVNIDIPELTTEGMSAQMRRLLQQLQWDMCMERSPYIKLAHILDYLVDILHLMLRVIMQSFEFTVSKHCCDAAKLEQLVLRIEKQLKLKLTKNKPGQSKTSTRKIDLSAESWPGDTCQVPLDSFVDILRRAIPLWQGRGMRSYHDAVKVWEVFFCLNYSVTHGCYDKDPAAVLAHAHEVEALGYEFLTAFPQVASQKDVTAYIHVSTVHLGQMIRRHAWQPRKVVQPWT